MATRQDKAPPQRPASAPSSVTRHREIETKLEVADGIDVPDLSRGKQARAAGFAGSTEPVSYRLDALYFDTDELDLLSSRITLRRREGGADDGWHAKLPSGGGARTEVGLPLTGARTVPAPLLDLVIGAARGRPLRPIARLRNHRTVRRLTDADGRELVEIADDRVTADVLDGDGRTIKDRRSSWREWEAELVDGTGDQLAAAVDGLRRAGAAPASSASKLARALAGPSAAEPAGGTGRPRRTGRSATAEVLAVLARLRDGLVSADLALRDGADDGLHDARAAARRLRSVLGVFAQVFPAGAGDALRAALREHGRVLSAARDLEVMQRRLTRQLAEEPAAFAQPAADHLGLEFAGRLPSALAAVGEHIRSAEYFEMLRDLDTFVSGGAGSRRGARPAAAELPVLLDAAWRDLRRQVDLALADPDRTDLVHDVRKKAKSVRYASEVAAAAVGDRAVVFAAAIEEIQEVLGEHHDAVLTSAFLADLALDDNTGGTAGFVFGRLHAFEQATAHGCLDDFTDAWDRVEDSDLPAAWIDA